MTSAAVNVASHIDPSTATHIALGAASFMPVVGSAAAVADAGLYLYEGDPVSAALSLTAVVPGGAILAQGGRALKAAKGAEEALTVVNDINKTEKAIKGADEAVDVFNDVSKVEKAAKDAEEAEQAGRRSLEQRLNGIKDEAERSAPDLTDPQKLAVERKPKLEPMFRGQRADVQFREILRREMKKDADLAERVVQTPYGKKGPDVIVQKVSRSNVYWQPHGPDWFDLTTRGAMKAHETLYKTWGVGRGIFR